MSRKLTKEEFIKRAIEKHGDKYDYSKVDYKNATTKVCIICKEDGHGEFFQRPGDHVKGSGCPKCSGNRIKLTTEEFIKRAKEVHGNKYDYCKVDYKNNYTKIRIICPDHGEFHQNAGSHLVGNGCPRCAVIQVKRSKQKTTGWFIEAANSVHGNRYDYMNVVYGLQVIRLYEFGEPSTEVARIDDFGIALNKLKYSRPFSIDNSDLVLSWFYEKNKDITEALDIIEGVILSGNITSNTYTINLQLTPIKSMKDFQTIATIIKDLYGVNVVMP